MQLCLVYGGDLKRLCQCPRSSFEEHKASLQNERTVKLCAITGLPACKNHPTQTQKKLTCAPKRTNPEEMLEGPSIIFMFLCAISTGVYWDVPQALSTKKVGTVVFPSIHGNQTCGFSHASRRPLVVLQQSLQHRRPDLVLANVSWRMEIDMDVQQILLLDNHPTVCIWTSIC